MNNSLLTSPGGAPSSQTTTLGRIVANVVDMQQQLATQFQNIQQTMESLRLEQRTTAQNLREDLRRTDDRAQKQVDELRSQHAKEVERLMDIIKTLLLKEKEPVRVEPARPSPQQVYNAGQSPASFFGQPNDILQRQMQHQLLLQQMAMQQQQTINAAPTAAGGLTSGAPVGILPSTPKAPIVIPSTTAQTQLRTPPPPSAGTVNLPISPETVKPKPVEVKKEDIVLPATTTALATSAPTAISFAKPVSPLTSVSTGKSLFGQSIFGSPKAPEKVEDKKEDVESKDEDHVEEYEPEVHVEPVYPLPELVEVKTGEEDEEVVFEERSKLYRYSSDTKEWKERGIGNLKILKDPKTGAHRIVMRREQIHKLCANHKITGKMDIKLMGKGDKAAIWNCFDCAEGEPVHEQLSAKFANAEICAEFIKQFKSAVSTATGGQVPQKTEQPKKDEKDVKAKSSEPTIPEKEGFGDKFNKKEGEWDCPDCYTRSSAATCPCCGTNKDGTKGEKDIFAKSSLPAATGTPKFSFGTSAQPATTPKFSFGLSSSKPVAETKPEAPKEISAEKPKFSFASAAAAASKEDTPTTTTPLKTALFGSSASTNTPKFSFGQSGSPATSIFGGSKATDGKTNTAPSFSFAAKKEETPSTSSPVSFSFKSSTPVTPATGKSMFGQSVAEKSESSATPSSANTTKIFGSGFGGTTANPFQAAVQSASTSIFNDEACKKAQEQFASQKKSVFGASASTVNKNKEDQGNESDGAAEEEYEPEVEFQPVVPLPDLVDVRTGEEGEDIVFKHRAKLYRFDSENKEWKERGLGDIKILKNPETGKHRVVMRREQVHKLCANFAIIPTINISQKKDVPNVYNWMCKDYAEATEGTDEMFSIKFKAEEVAKEFYDKFVAAQTN